MPFSRYLKIFTIKNIPNIANWHFFYLSLIVDLELSTYMDPLALSAEIDFRLGSVTLDP